MGRHSVSKHVFRSWIASTQLLLSFPVNSSGIACAYAQTPTHCKYQQVGFVELPSDDGRLLEACTTHNNCNGTDIAPNRLLRRLECGPREARLTYLRSLREGKFLLYPRMRLCIDPPTLLQRPPTRPAGDSLRSLLQFWFTCVPQCALVSCHDSYLLPLRITSESAHARLFRCSNHQAICDADIINVNDIAQKENWSDDSYDISAASERCDSTAEQCMISWQINDNVSSAG